MKRDYVVFIDSGSESDPTPRRFASLQAAQEAAREWDSPFVWIINSETNIVYMKDGVRQDVPMETEQ